MLLGSQPESERERKVFIGLSLANINSYFLYQEVTGGHTWWHPRGVHWHGEMGLSCWDFLAESFFFFIFFFFRGSYPCPSTRFTAWCRRNLNYWMARWGSAIAVTPSPIMASPDGKAGVVISKATLNMVIQRVSEWMSDCSLYRWFGICWFTMWNSGRYRPSDYLTTSPWSDGCVEILYMPNYGTRGDSICLHYQTLIQGGCTR